ncbi:MAG: putative 4-amino-4-deoxy-L-arabinose transferase and related glycosyltransferase of family-like [Candidatus Eremiobacteraeota bacterium]|nr:putative 4-amino-4-deoxy-L-arabinose transferase and related glycosyltransferase of family-like [Candidatus Eremiobacteraeota bacterium]
MTASRLFWIAALAFTAAGAVLRFKGIHDPIFDHPGWRQGDTSAIARNFAQLQYNIFFPQVDYNGPPPNYVELELQIVPFLAATLYKIFGVHEVFGRLISLAFGIATIPVIAAFGRWLFSPPSSRAGNAGNVGGIAAAAAFAVLPGAWYYSHTFMPDTAMVFFTTCALYACARWIVDDEARSWRGWWPAALLLMLAFLAKPVAVTATIPIAACAVARLGWRGALTRPQLWALFAAAFVPLALYDRFVSAHAEWHWASGITKLHVIPSLQAALTSPHAFAQKAISFAHAMKMLATTMLGPVGFALAILGFCVRLRSRSDALLWGWLGGGLLYAYVVVTVERVDYYLYLLLPLAALAVGRLCAFAFERWGGDPQRDISSERDTRGARDASPEPRAARERRTTLAGIAAVVWIAALVVGYREIAPYYRWSRVNYVRAKQLDATLAPGALVVMGHYDPSILYTIGRKGWEEDPHLWTPFNEQSAIRKGARYFISVEHARLKQTNLELYCWLARFPVLDPAAAWPVYETDPAKVLPRAEERWRAFRRREMAGAFANWRREWKSAPDPCR